MAPLSAVCQVANTRNPADDPAKPFQYIDISSIDTQSKAIAAPQSLLGRDAPSRARQIVCEGDVIVATTRPNLNAVAQVGRPFDKQICSTGFCVLRCNPDQLDPRYLYWFVQSQDFISKLTALTRGALYPAVTDKQVRSQPIPLAPLAEQKRIAALLDRQIDAVARMRAALNTQLSALASLKTRLVIAALEEGAAQMKLGECLSEVTKGVGSQWRNYRVVGATRSGLAPAKEKVGKVPERYKPVVPGTVFYNPMRILLGSIAMIDDGENAGITSPDYVVVRCRDGILHHRWFYYWLRSSRGAAFIKALARGAVRERLLFRRLATGEFSVPTWSAQMRFAREVEATRRLRLDIEAQLHDIDKLPAALLRAAFRGEL